MKKIDLDKIMALENKATKGPWTSYIEGRDHTSGSSFIMTGTETDRDYDLELDRIRIEDQDFIAMARNAVPGLVKEVIRLQKILNDNAIAF